MFVTAKTVLSSYGKLNRLISDMANVIEQAAVKSYYDAAPCEVLAERICTLIEKKNLICDLKARAKRALKSLSAEDVEVLAAKYGRSEKELYFSKRSYFRKINAALSRFEEALSAQGVTGEIFRSEYADKISFLDVKRRMVIDEEAAVARRVRKMKPAVLGGVYRETVQS